MNNSRTWSVRAFREGDEAGIFALWQAVRGGEVYGYDAWLRWWRWMFRDNPRGQGRIFLAVDGEKVVGQHAMVPVKVKTGAEIRTGGLTLNIMTRPEYRRQGVFETLARASYQEAGNSGLDFVYGFPNRRSRPGFLGKLGWREVAPLPVMIRPLNWETTLRSRVGSRLLSRLAGAAGAAAAGIAAGLRPPIPAEGVRIARAPFFDARVDRFWQKVSSRWPCAVVRDRVYLNWRYATLDDRSKILIAEADGTGEMAGYLVARQAMAGNSVRLAHVFELVAESAPVLHGLVREAVIRLGQDGVDALVCQSLTDRAHRRALARSGFIRLPLARGILPPFCLGDVFRRNSRLTFSPEDWFVQTGDSDAMNGYQEA